MAETRARRPLPTSISLRAAIERKASRTTTRETPSSSANAFFAGKRITRREPIAANVGLEGRHDLIDQAGVYPRSGHGGQSLGRHFLSLYYRFYIPIAQLEAILLSTRRLATGEDRARVPTSPPQERLGRLSRALLTALVTYDAVNSVSSSTTARAG